VVGMEVHPGEHLHFLNLVNLKITFAVIGEKCKMF